MRLPALALLLAVALSGCPGGDGDGGYVGGVGDRSGLGGGADGTGDGPGVDGSDDAGRDRTPRNGIGDVGMVRA